MGAMEGGGGGGSSGAYLAREYIWGPGDAWHPASVDELLVYFGENRQAWGGRAGHLRRRGRGVRHWRYWRHRARRCPAALRRVGAGHRLLLYPFLSTGRRTAWPRHTMSGTTLK